MSLLKAEPRSFDQSPKIFLFLLIFRWASLLPAAWLLVSGEAAVGKVAPSILLAVAATDNLLITVFHRSLNGWLLRRPILLGVDLIFTVALLVASGGALSPYYLYALSPLLAGAFFFQMRGALISTAVFTLLFLTSFALPQDLIGTSMAAGSIPNLAFTQLVGAWAVAALFGYASMLLKELRLAHTDLEAASDNLAQQNLEIDSAHRQLKIIHDLTVSLQAAPDINTVQKQVLQVVTRDLGFRRAVTALVDPIGDRVEKWRAGPEDGEAAPPVSLPLVPESGLLVQVMLAATPQWVPGGQVLTYEQTINTWLGEGPWLLIPLILREHAVGALLLHSHRSFSELPESRLKMLTSVANQAAVSLGTTMLCIDRAQRLAVEQERNRIARDIHDTVAQSLFGIIFSLDACIQMLPRQAEQVRLELVELQGQAIHVRDEVRRSILDIWPSPLTLEQFQTGLAEHATNCCRPRLFRIEYACSGDFDRLSPLLRRTLYRVAQEALTNAARHSGAESALVNLDVEDHRVRLNIRDDGCGFDLEAALESRSGRERFGLRGIRERIRALGGEFAVQSGPENGTMISINVPM